MSKKAVTVEQLLESARQGEALTMQMAEAAAADLAQRPKRDEVNDAINAAITGALGRAY